MTLLAETIMQTVQSVLAAGLDAEVIRGRISQLENSRFPVVGLYQGDEELARVPGLTIMDEALEIRTSVGTISVEENIETDLNELRRQVHLLMMAPNTLNLDYVEDIIPSGVNEPTVSVAAEMFKGEMIINWIIKYRHQYTDAGLAP